MKKILLFLFSVFMLFSSCKKDQSTAVTLSGINLDKTTLDINYGDTAMLKVSFNPSGAPAQAIVWSSSNDKIVEVFQNGSISTLGTGQATVTAKTQDGKFSASCNVNVKFVMPTGISLNTTTITLQEGDTYQMSATFTPANATDPGADWNSSNTSVATIDISGVITAVSAGQTTITGSAHDDPSINKSCLVTVNSISQLISASLSYSAASGLMENVGLHITNSTAADIIVTRIDLYNTKGQNFNSITASTTNPIAVIHAGASYDNSNLISGSLSAQEPGTTTIQNWPADVYFDNHGRHYKMHLVSFTTKTIIQL